MTNVNPSRLGKTHRQENFPVASLLVRAQHRPIILAFYYFVRAADDVADDPALTSEEKIERLDRMEAALLGESATASHNPPGGRIGLSNIVGITSRSCVSANRNICPISLVSDVKGLASPSM